MPSLSHGWRPLGIALIYALLGAAGLALGLAPNYASPLFPASGFALSAVLWFGTPALAWLWLGYVCMELVLHWNSGSIGMANLFLAAGMATGAALQAWVGNVLVRRGQGEAWRRLENEKEVAVFLMLGGVAACVISASFGSAALFLRGFVPASGVLHVWWTWYVGDVLGVLIFAPLTLLALSRGNDLWRERRRRILVPMLLTLTLAALCFVASSRWEEAQQVRQVQDQGEILEHQLHGRVLDKQTILVSLGRFIEITPNLDQARFEQFTRASLADNPDLMALSFNAHVPRAARAAYEAQAGARDGVPSITERDAGGNALPAGLRDEYVPVTHIAPLARNRAALGFDINSEPLRRDAIVRARASGRMAITAPVQLVQDGRSGPGFLALQPVYGSEAAPRPLLGFAVAVTKVDAMAGPALRIPLPAGLVFHLSDPGAPEASRLLYRSDGGAAAPDTRYAWRTLLSVGDRDWELLVFPTPAYLEQHRSWVAYGVGVAGLLFAAILQLLMLGMTGRAELVRRKVDEQTAEIKRKSAALEESEEKLRTALTFSPNAIFIAGADGRFVFANREAENLLGYSRDELLRMGVPDALPPDEKEKVLAAFLRNLEGEHQFFETALLHRDGRCVLVEINGVRLPDGKVLGEVRDITQNKLNAEELERHRHHLEALVEERTVALSAAKEVAEAASRAKSTFLATMSHELRTPMNAIMGMTALAQKRATDPAQSDQLCKVSQASRQLLAIINDILDISRIESDQLTLEQSEFDLAGVLGTLAGLVSPSASDKGLALRTDLAPELGRLRLKGDPLRLGQILLNLTNNAVKFTTEGAVSVQARLLEETPDRVLLRFEVRDTGIGMSEEEQKRIFAPFEQADGSRTRRYGGTGLGLAISKRLAGLMGGDMGVASQLGSGSTFWFTVRLARGEPSTGTPDGVQSAEEQIRACYSGARVLLVEDEPVNQEVSRELLKEAGLTVDLAEDGAEAVDKATTGNYDLVLMDIRMPKVDGLEAAQRIHRIPGREKLIIIAMTANAFAEDRQKCLAAGMNDFIAKPVEPELLFSTLLKWLAPARG
ncbi:MAG: CHASE domain-containing protein [Rhodocyclaceae bacterium]|nr:CHASE domain-containing protein [Rhodocyclaceae bacterium]